MAESELEQEPLEVASDVQANGQVLLPDLRLDQKLDFHPPAYAFRHLTNHHKKQRCLSPRSLYQNISKNQSKLYLLLYRCLLL